MNKQTEPSRPTSHPEARDDILKRLARLQLTLTDLLDAVDDDAQWMDASMADAHRLVEELRSCAKQIVFSSHGSMNSAFQRTCKAFAKTRIEENDACEVYFDALERYQRRRVKDLSVAESDSDKLALVRRRRDYISKLLAFQAKASAILDKLSERSSSAAVTPRPTRHANALAFSTCSRARMKAAESRDANRYVIGLPKLLMGEVA